MLLIVSSTHLLTPSTVRRSCLYQVHSHLNYHRLGKRTWLLVNLSVLVHLKKTQRGLAIFQSSVKNRGLELSQKRHTSSPGAHQGFSTSQKFARPGWKRDTGKERGRSEDEDRLWTICWINEQSGALDRWSTIEPICIHAVGWPSVDYRFMAAIDSVDKSCSEE